MAKTRNKVELLGYLGGDPEISNFANHGKVANISLATTEKWKDKTTGKDQERTEWHRVVFFNGLADIVADHLIKGAKVFIDGSLRTRKWQDSEGNDRYTTEVVANDLTMLSARQIPPVNYDDFPEANEARALSG